MGCEAVSSRGSVRIVFATDLVLRVASATVRTIMLTSIPLEVKGNFPFGHLAVTYGTTSKACRMLSTFAREQCWP